MSRKRDFREISAVARALGYTFVGLTARHHLRWRNARGVVIVCGSELSTTRNFKNATAKLRQNSKTDRKDIRYERDANL